MFDYESEKINKIDLSTSKTCALLRNNESVVKSDRFGNKGEILRIDCDKENFYVKPSISENMNDEKCINALFNRVNLPWISVKDSVSYKGIKGYKINLNDVIKLGRVKLRLKEIKRSSDLLKIGEVRGVQIIDNLSENAVKSKAKRKALCRICYCNEEEMNSDLIQPCLCSGSMKYIHFCCLQQWLKSKGIDKKTTTATAITYSLKAIECELCKTVLPDCIKQHGKIYNLFDFLKPEFSNYLIFEIITHDSASVRSLVSIDITNKKRLKMGRGQDSDIRISDISVSRHHADMILLNDGYSEINLEDNKSKFGTLIYSFNSSMKILDYMSYTIQVGRSLLKLTAIKSSCNLFGCMSKKRDASKDKKNSDYQIQNFQHIYREGSNFIIKEIKTITNSMATESSVDKTNSVKADNSVNKGIQLEKNEVQTSQDLFPEEEKTMEKNNANNEQSRVIDGQSIGINNIDDMCEQVICNRPADLDLPGEDYKLSKKDPSFRIMNEEDQLKVLVNINLDKSGFAVVNKFSDGINNKLDKDELILSQMMEEAGDYEDSGQNRVSNDYIRDYDSSKKESLDRLPNNNVRGFGYYQSNLELKRIKAAEVEQDHKKFSSVPNNRSLNKPNDDVNN